MKYTIEFEVEQIKVVIASLQELPYKVSNPVINVILEQVGKQELAAKAEESKPVKESKVKEPVKKE